MNRLSRVFTMGKNPKNLEEVQNSFSIQADKFENDNMNFSKETFLDYTVESMELDKDDIVLEAAAGTAACARSIAPFVHSIVCLDATKAMLDIGKKEAKKNNLLNIKFLQGLVEDIPFSNGVFDIVVSRLAFHHFEDIEKSFEEMKRVLKKSGKLVIIDMEAASEEIRQIQDSIEMMRDTSHVKNISRKEFIDLYEKNNFTIRKNETTEISVSLDAWMELTNTSSEIADKIRGKMEKDIKGEEKTGFNPYLLGNKIYFLQRWMLIIGEKQA